MTEKKNLSKTFRKPGELLLKATDNELWISGLMLMLLFLLTESWLDHIATINCHANFVLSIVDIQASKEAHKTAPNYIRSINSLKLLKKERKKITTHQ